MSDPSATALGVGSAELTAVVLPDEPYRGINSFRFADAPIFFGRSDDVQRLLRCVTVYRGTLLYGESGVGKTSMVNAGFLPEAVRHGFTADRLRVQPHRGEELVVERVSASTDDGMKYLPSNLVDDSSTIDKATLSIGAFMQRVAGIPPDRKPLLIFDQFEELITLFEEAPDETKAADAHRMQAELMDAIVLLLTKHVAPVKLLFSFREDYLAKFTRLFRRTPDLPDQYLRLTPPRIDDLEGMIRGPLEKYPAAYGGKFPPSLPKDLAEAFRERVGTGQLVLSEVQIACLQLWKSADPAALLAAPAGLPGIIEQFFTGVIDQLSDPEQQAVGALLSRMVTRSGARNIVSEADLLTTPTPLTPEKLGALLDSLDNESRRLVRRELRQDALYYTIVSEFLVPWIRRWKEAQLREEAARQAKAELDELEKKAKAERDAMERAHELERARVKAHRMRRLAWFVGGVAVLLIAGLTVLGWTYTRLREQERARSQLSAALSDTNNTLRYVRDSVELVAQRRADSIAAMLPERLAVLARADSLSRRGASIQDQLRAERDAKAQLQLALAREQELRKAAEESGGSATATYQSIRSRADSLDRQVRALEQMRGRYVALLSQMRNSKAESVRDLYVTSCRVEPLCTGEAKKEEELPR